MSSERRAMLLKRSRKLEQILGKPLTEAQIESLIIEPRSGRMPFAARFPNDAWPTRSSSQRRMLVSGGVNDSIGGIGIDANAAKAVRVAFGLNEFGEDNEPPDLNVGKGVNRAPSRLDSPEVAAPQARRDVRRDTTWPDQPDENDEATRRARRQQLAKVSIVDEAERQLMAVASSITRCSRPS